MKIQTFSYTAGGWSSEPDGARDSEQSLVILFGASNLVDRPAPVQRVIDAYFRSRIMGCSSSGEIPGTRFYSYGEISPYATGHCDLHNQTMTLTTINEA